MFSISAQNDSLEVVTPKNRTLKSINNNHLENPSSSKSPINIHIEVDIDPPKDNNDQLSADELTRLGLPVTHVHYSNVNKQLTPDRHDQTEELLAPSDIKVTYSEETDQPLRDKLVASMASEAEVTAYENFETYNNALYGTPEPPRALPSQVSAAKDAQFEPFFKGSVVFRLGATSSQKWRPQRPNSGPWTDF